MAEDRGSEEDNNIVTYALEAWQTLSRGSVTLFTLTLCVATTIHKQMTCQSSRLAPDILCRKSCRTSENQRDVVDNEIQRPSFLQTHNFTSKCFTGFML